MTQPTETQQDIWRGLFRAHGRARKLVDAALSDARLPALETYDLLLELDRASARDGVQANELESRLLLPQYGISRLVSRLTQQGLLRQEVHPQDKRVRLLFITAAGRQLRHRMWAVYGAAISRFLDGKLSAGEARQLGSLLDKLDGT